MINPASSNSESFLGLEWRDWQPYFKPALIGLFLIWLAVIAYLLFWPVQYTSSWGLLVLGRDAAASVNLQGIGQASIEPSSRPSEYQDPRDDYVYLATSLDTLGAAAERVDLDVDDYGEPQITTDTESAIISFDITGRSPEEAQGKSIALYDVLFEKIEALRQEEIARRQAETLIALERDQNVLSKAQTNMAEFKENSLFHSEDQLSSLSTSVEDLRTKKAEKMATLKGIEQKLAGLTPGVPGPEPEMKDVYNLQADPVYQKQLAQYAEIYAKYTSLEAILGANNPTLLETKGELESALWAMQERASFLLNKDVTESLLVKLNSLEWATARGEYDSLKAEIGELEYQIGLLEQRLSQLDQEKNSFARIETDFQVAESILAGTLTRLNFNQGDIYAIYPPIQLVVPPNLPDEPSSPDLVIGFVAGMAASFVFVALLIFLKWERNSPWRNPQEWVP